MNEAATTELEYEEAVASDLDESPLIIGGRSLATRYFLAPLAGYTHLAFRRVVRECGGVGLATTDLVQAMHLVRGSKWARELVRTHPDDSPLSVQIYGGVTEHLVKAAVWLEEHGYAAVDINMGCPMAKITGTGGGARLMCRADGACDLVERVVNAVRIPVTVKMRLGWDRESITAPALAREFEKIGVAAITIHGRTRQQGFRGTVHLDGIRAVVDAIENIPVVGNGDVRTPADAFYMRRFTGCDAVAIGRGALFDPFIFRKIKHAIESPPLFLGGTGGGNTSIDSQPPGALPRIREADEEPSADEQIRFLRRHFELMVEQHGEFQSCLMLRKFAAWYGARLGIPEDLERRLRMFESIAEFGVIVDQIRERHGTRRNPAATNELRIPNGPVEYW